MVCRSSERYSKPDDKATGVFEEESLNRDVSVVQGLHDGH